MAVTRSRSFLRRHSSSMLSLSRASQQMDWPWLSTVDFDEDEIDSKLTALPALPQSRPTSFVSFFQRGRPGAAGASMTNTAESPVAAVDEEPVSEAPTPPKGPPGPPGGWLADKMSSGQQLGFNLMVCMIQILQQACITTSFPIIRYITGSLNINDPAVLPWVVAAYAISFGTTILLFGRIGDIFGHKNMVVLGFAWLSVFSVLAGVSDYVNYEVFFVARAMQGFGAAMMNPNALALLGRSYPPGSKGKIIAFSAFGLCGPLGAYLGMLGGAILAQLAHWTWCFYAMAIAAALLGVAALIVLPTAPKSPKQMLPFRQKLAQMDWLGGITGVCGLVAIQVALISAPVQNWKTQYIFMLLIIGLLLFTFFIIIELRIADEPLVPFKLLNSNVAFVLGAMACGWATFGVWTYYLWRYLLVILRFTPLEAALHVLPIVPMAFIASVITAVLMRRTKPAWILFWALIAFTLGPAFLSCNHQGVTYWSFTFLSLLVTPFGMDMSLPSATFTMSNSLPMDKQGVAGSLVVTVVNYSISLGLGLASTVEVHVNNHGANIWDGIRGGWFMGIGLGCLGVFVCTAFVIKTILGDRKAVAPAKASKPAPVMQEIVSHNEKGGVSQHSLAPVSPAVVREVYIPGRNRQRPAPFQRVSTRSSGRGSWSGKSTLLPDSAEQSRQPSQNVTVTRLQRVPDSATHRVPRHVSQLMKRYSQRSEAQQRRDMEPALRIQETWDESHEQVAGTAVNTRDSLQA